MPFRNKDSIFRVRGRVVWAGVERDDFGKITIKVGKILDGCSVRMKNQDGD